ncbi:MAG: cation:proton antiporter [Phycisphaerae bacterium]|nr:cation:proton antiporter [Phycisphaerae bacterium]
MPSGFADIHLGILMLLGIGVLGGALGAWFFQKIRIPQVVGYITFGILIGKSGLNVLHGEDIEQLRSFTWFALGIIGFLVGGELKFETFKQYGKQFVQILLWEGLLAFFIVAVMTFGVVYWVTHSISASLAAGIVFGAIASATDPASTVEVLWEYRARGVLTTTIIAIVALDDALAMTLYGIGTSCAEMLIGQGGSILKEVLRIIIELGGSVCFGLLGGSIMVFFLRYVHQKQERMLAIGVGMLLCVIGLASALKLDVILVTMAMGMLLVNLTPHRSEKLLTVVRSFAVPIYVMFFVLVGARLQIANMPGWMWAIVALYVIGRSSGKMLGCFVGAKLSGASESVQKYSGLGIFAQGGVAIGLSIMASQHLGNIQITDEFSLGDLIISGVTATTFIVQIIGPAMVKLSIRLAGENDRNITEDDVIDRLKVSDVALKDVGLLYETDPIGKAVQRFSESENMAYPVVNAEEKLAGILTLTQLKDILLDSDCWAWMVVADVLVPGMCSVPESMALKEAIELMEDSGSEQLPVVRSAEDGVSAGILDRRHTRKIIEQEMIRIQAVV